jgi:hypothetical protein
MAIKKNWKKEYMKLSKQELISEIDALSKALSVSNKVAVKLEKILEKIKKMVTK